MKKLAILFFYLLMTSCARVETASDNASSKFAQAPKTAPSIETNLPLKTVTPNVKLNSKQAKYLNQSVPPPVRAILEKAEIFEILAEVDTKEATEADSRDFHPNRIFRVTDEKDKENVLKAFYSDAASDDPPAICYEPHHAIRAVYQGKVVNVEICFSCSRFFVKSDFGEFEGTIKRAKRKSEDLFTKLIDSQSVEIK